MGLRSRNHNYAISQIWNIALFFAWLSRTALSKTYFSSGPACPMGQSFSGCWYRKDTVGAIVFPIKKVKQPKKMLGPPASLEVTREQSLVRVPRMNSTVVVVSCSAMCYTFSRVNPHLPGRWPNVSRQVYQEVAPKAIGGPGAADRLLQDGRRKNISLIQLPKLLSTKIIEGP